MNVRILIATAVCAVTILAGCKAEAPPPNPPRAVNVVRVGALEADPGNRYAGEVRARYETPLGFRVPGKVTERHVDVGAVVRRGQVLARLDPVDLQLAAEAARQQVSATKSNLDQQRTEYERFHALHAQGFISAAELDRRKAALDMAAAQAAQARAQWEANRNQSVYATLTADHDGVVTAVSAEVGQVVDRGMPVMRIARPGEKEVAISIPEGRIVDARRARDAEIRLWADPERVYKGRVRELSPSADGVTRTYSMKVTVLDADDNVTLGMTANVALAAPATGPGMRLPSSAIFQQGDKAAVWVVDGATSQVALRPVKVLRYADDHVVLGDGLSAGESVVRAGVHKLFAGEKVRVLAEAGK
ncbi:MAG: efflux RND transporter periplasmic adaptor subunit [Burkholderiales bacterium]